MVSITLSVPENVREEMKRFPEVNWSALIRKVIEEKVGNLSLKERMKNKLKDEENFNEWAVKLIREGRR